MAFWWVNQNQTFLEESQGGYLWSPRTRKDGGYNRFYENMTQLEPGDIVFSYAKQKIIAIGIIQKTAVSSVKPSEFNTPITDNWGSDGWLVSTSFHKLEKPISPKDFWEKIRPLLPEKYSPMSLTTGAGNQGTYLASISEDLGNLLVHLTGSEALIRNAIKDFQNIDDEGSEDKIEDQIKQRPDLTETEKEQLVKSRRGQGLFRERLESIEKKDRVTGLDIKSHLRASHIKPWRDSSNEERLDGNNGLLLSPHVDHLFDKGFISFSDEGEILISPLLDRNILSLWKIDPTLNAGRFNKQQSKYLAYHQEKVFKGEKKDHGRQR